VTQAMNKVKGIFKFSIQWKLILLGLGVVAAFLAIILGYILPGMQNALITEKENKTKEHVQAAWTIADSFYQQSQDGTMTEAAAMIMAEKEIGALRYGDDSAGYFWISDMNAY
jgi:hypothetical protein